MLPLAIMEMVGAKAIRAPATATGAARAAVVMAETPTAVETGMAPAVQQVGVETATVVGLRAAGLRAVDLRAVGLRAAGQRAVSLRAVGLQAVDQRAVDQRAVGLRAVTARNRTEHPPQA
jgi:hypothetical protein